MTWKQWHQHVWVERIKIFQSLRSNFIQKSCQFVTYDWQQYLCSVKTFLCPKGLVGWQTIRVLLHSDKMPHDERHCFHKIKKIKVPFSHFHVSELYISIIYRPALTWFVTRLVHPRGRFGSLLSRKISTKDEEWPKEVIFHGNKAEFLTAVSSFKRE